MMLTRLHGRRALLGAFANVVLARAWRLAPGTAVADEARDKATEDKGEAGKARPGKADGEAKKGKGVVLTIVVMGDGKKIQQAEVQVRFSASAGGESMLLTDRDGQATFKSAGSGTAKVRVIATGWASALQEVTLKEGTQQLTITLTPLADAGQPGNGKRRGDGKR
jgi:hypothetical protein